MKCMMTDWTAQTEVIDNLVGSDTESSLADVEMATRHKNAACRRIVSNTAQDGYKAPGRVAPKGSWGERLNQHLLPSPLKKPRP